jgi:hypothetical protein
MKWARVKRSRDYITYTIITTIIEGVKNKQGEDIPKNIILQKPTVVAVNVIRKNKYEKFTQNERTVVVKA